MAWETLLFDTRGAVAVITFNRPSRSNAINLALQRELIDVLDQCEKDGSTRALVVTGGPKCFSVGADVKELGEFELLPEFLAQGRALFHRVETLVLEGPKLYTTKAGCECIGDFWPGFNRISRTPTRSFSNSAL